MPCYRCGARQVDPVRGPSLWKRGVRAGAQVLVCPDCQHGAEWLSELEHCVRCGSEQLARVLGETICRACRQPVTSSTPAVVSLFPEQRAASPGAASPGAASPGAASAGAASAGPAEAAEMVAGSGLAAEVADALDRIFHRK